MAEGQPAPLPPQDSGVEPVQTVATHVVSGLPDAVKKVGELGVYPATDAIAHLRADGGGIRSDIGLMLLQTMVHATEYRAAQDQEARRALEARIVSLQEEVGGLKVDNARLEEHVKQAESEKQARTILLSFGGVGLGLAAQIAVEKTTPLAIICSIIFFAIFICGFIHPRARK